MAMRASDEKLKSCLMEISKQEERLLEVEMQDTAPYIFSESFEQKMNHILYPEKPGSIFTKMAHGMAKVCCAKTVRFAATMALVVTGCILTFGTPKLCAGSTGMSILEWLEHFFVVQEGEISREEDGVLFTESQIGYLPEGFEKVEEKVMFSKAVYRYEDANENYIDLQVSRDKISLGIDGKEIFQNIGISEAGFEYQYICKEMPVMGVLTWVDKQNIYYCLQTTLDKEEAVQIMNSIMY